MRGRTLIALGVMAALGGCQESGFDESRETQRPLKVQHALDPLTGTKVPGVAKRPMTLTADALGDTLALGVRPVRAALPGGTLPPYLRSAAAGVEVVPPLTELDLAATEAAGPDLILGSKEGQRRLYEELSRIAPTVMSEGDNWKLNLRLHGEALGRTNDAEKLLIDWDARVAEVRSRLGDGDVSVALRGPGAGAPPALAEQLLAELGLEAGTGGDRVLRVDVGPHWSSGGLLAARAALQDIRRAL